MKIEFYSKNTISSYFLTNAQRRVMAARLLAGAVDPGQLENAQKMLFGGLIVLFLVKEPEGLARLLRRLSHRVLGNLPGPTSHVMTKSSGER